MDVITSTVRMRGDLYRNTADLDAVNARLFDHERRLVRLETLGEMRTVDTRVRRPRLGRADSE